MVAVAVAVTVEVTVATAAAASTVARQLKYIKSETPEVKQGCRCATTRT